MAMAKFEGRNTTSFLFGISLALILVVLGSNLLGTNAASAATKDDDEETATCENTQQQKNPQLHPQDKNLWLYHFSSTGSTQDEAKRIVEQQQADETVQTFCVTATEQTDGRGTSGRQWMGQKGNTFVTIGIPQSSWMQGKWTKQVPLTLLPLKIGTLVAARVQELLNQCSSSSSSSSTRIPQGEDDRPMVTVKWPNDVLVNEKKVSGVLIESANGWFLIGIGINLAYAPPVPTAGPNHGRPSTSIQEHCSSSQIASMSTSTSNAAQQLGVDLAHDLHQFINNDNVDVQIKIPSTLNNAGERILKEWKQWVDWDMELVMRDTPQQEHVRLVDLLPDGRVQVVGTKDGVQRTLVSDYFL